MGEMSERYVRDHFHPSHAQTPLYKGNSSNYVRDERFFDVRGKMEDVREIKTKMNMEEKELKAKDIPWGYTRCFNDACKRKDTCMHYLANVLSNQQDRFTGMSVYPTAWLQDECPCYCEKKLVRKAWGFSHLYDNVPKYHKAEARCRVLAQAWVHTTVPIMVKTKSPPSSRKTSCKSSPNLAVPRASSLITMKRIGISNDRK